MPWKKRDLELTNMLMLTEQPPANANPREGLEPRDWGWAQLRAPETCRQPSTDNTRRTRRKRQLASKATNRWVFAVKHWRSEWDSSRNGLKRGKSYIKTSTGTSTSFSRNWLSPFPGTETHYLIKNLWWHSNHIPPPASLHWMRAREPSAIANLFDVINMIRRVTTLRPWAEHRSNGSREDQPVAPSRYFMERWVFYTIHSQYHLKPRTCLVSVWRAMGERSNLTGSLEFLICDPGCFGKSLFPLSASVSLSARRR